MLKLLRRFFAYFIDMMVILIIVQTITSIPFINRQINKYEDVYNNYLENTNQYTSFRLDLVESFDDKELTKKEYQELVKDNANYEELLNKYYKDDKLSKKNYDKLLKEIDNTYMKEYKSIYYKLDKYSIVNNISYLVVTLLYFVGFNIITGGVTLGKKLARLKIINNKDSNKKVSTISYLIRFIMLYQPIYYLVRLVGIKLLNIGNYYDIVNIVYSIHSYLEFMILALVIVRLDGRGLHDLASGTKVVSVELNGNEV